MTDTVQFDDVLQRLESKMRLFQLAATCSHLDCKKIVKMVLSRGGGENKRCETICMQMIPGRGSHRERGYISVVIYGNSSVSNIL